MNSIGKLFKMQFQKIFGQVENIKGDLPMPIMQRCLMASWNELDGLNQKIEIDICDASTPAVWLAGHVLTQSGSRLIDDPNRFYIRKDNYQKEIGFCYVTMEEIESRGNYDAIEPPISIENMNSPKFS